MLSSNVNGENYPQPLEQYDEKKSSYIFNNSNGENEVVMGQEQGEDRRLPKINFVYTNSIYNYSSNCNSLRDNTFSINQWNPKNLKIKNRKKSEEYGG